MPGHRGHVSRKMQTLKKKEEKLKVEKVLLQRTMPSEGYINSFTVAKKRKKEKEIKNSVSWKIRKY